MNLKYPTLLMMFLLTNCINSTEPKQVTEKCQKSCITAVLQKYAGRYLPTRLADNQNAEARTLETIAETLIVKDQSYERHSSYLLNPLIIDGFGSGKVSYQEDSMFIYFHDLLMQKGKKIGNSLFLSDWTDTTEEYSIIN